jgi:hypothetical protein
VEGYPSAPLPLELKRRCAMRVFVLVTYVDEFMRYLYECYQDCAGLPSEYDPEAIADWLADMGESFVWTITEQDVSA